MGPLAGRGPVLFLGPAAVVFPIMISRAVGFARHLVFGHLCGSTLRRGVSALMSEPPFKLGRTDRRKLLVAIAARTPSIMAADASRVVDPPSLGHLEWSSWVLAAFQELRPRFGSDEEAIEFLGRASIKGFDTWVVRIGVWIMLRACRGNLDRIANFFAAGLKQFGDAFTLEIVKEDNGIDLQITRCFYVQFFRAHNLEALTTVLCRLDSLWFDRIDPVRHGLRFDTDRYTTQSRGSDRCHFPIVRCTVDR